LPKKSKARKIEFIPGAGAQSLKDLISMAIAWASDYIVLLDNDEEGRAARTRYEEFFGHHEAQRLVLYTTPAEGDNVQLEDFLSEADSERLKDITDVTSAKRGIAELFFSSNDLRRQFFGGLDDVSMENLRPVLKRLDQLGN